MKFLPENLTTLYHLCSSALIAYGLGDINLIQLWEAMIHPHQKVHPVWLLWGHPYNYRKPLTHTLI